MQLGNQNSRTKSFLDAYHQKIKPLPGYEPMTDRSALATLDVNRCGGCSTAFQAMTPEAHGLEAEVRGRQFQPADDG